MYNSSTGISHLTKTAFVRYGNGSVTRGPIGYYAFASNSTESLVFAEITPVRSSGTVIVHLFAWIDAGTDLGYSTGQGGLTGATGKVKASFAFGLSSIVES